MQKLSSALTAVHNHLFPSVNFTIIDVPKTAGNKAHSVTVAIPIELQQKLALVIRQINTSSTYMTFIIRDKSSTDAKTFEAFETILREKRIIPLKFLKASRDALCQTAGPGPHRLCSATGKSWIETNLSEQSCDTAKQLRTSLNKISESSSLEVFFNAVMLDLSQQNVSVDVVRSAALEIAIRKNVCVEEVELTLCSRLGIHPLMVIGYPLWNKWKETNPPSEELANIYAQIENWAHSTKTAHKRHAFAPLRHLPHTTTLQPAVFLALIFTSEQLLKLGTRQEIGEEMIKIILAPLSSPLYAFYTKQLSFEQNELSIDLIAKMKSLEFSPTKEIFLALAPEFDKPFHSVTLRALLLEIAIKQELSLDEVLSFLCAALPETSPLLRLESSFYNEVILPLLSQEQLEGASAANDALNETPYSFENMAQRLKIFLEDEEIHLATHLALYNSLASLYDDISYERFARSCPTDLTSPTYFLALQRMGKEEEMTIQNNVLELLDHKQLKEADLIDSVAKLLLSAPLCSFFSRKAINDTLEKALDNFSSAALIKAARRLLEDPAFLMGFARNLNLDDPEYNEENLYFFNRREKEHSSIIKRAFALLDSPEELLKHLRDSFAPLQEDLAFRRNIKAGELYSNESKEDSLENSESAASGSSWPSSLALSSDDTYLVQEPHPVTFLAACNTWKRLYGPARLKDLVEVLSVDKILICSPLYPLVLEQIDQKEDLVFANVMLEVSPPNKETLLSKAAALFVENPLHSSFTKKALVSYLENVISGFDPKQLEDAIEIAEIAEEYDIPEFSPNELKQKEAITEEYEMV